MKKKNNITTGEIPLKFAEILSKLVLREFENGSMYEEVGDITAELLEYWFSEDNYDNRNINFHEGQKQAILNAIYCYEVLKTKTIFDLYSIIEKDINKELLDDNFIHAIQNEKYSLLKYCIKMATGTGKTFVMNALMIWQILNAMNKKNSKEDVNWIKNFLIIAPGVVVYDRLLDSFFGKEDSNGIRDFNTSDIKRNEELFLPYEYRECFYSFIQNNTVKKEEIGKKIVGDGLIAITNWQYLNDFEQNELNNEEKNVVYNDFSFNSTKQIANDVLQLQPSKNAGSDLNVLDAKYFNGNITKYLSNLDSLCIINDEAHHIHDEDKNDILVWDYIIRMISKNKSNGFLQLDFSATPYNNVSSNSAEKNYFPHIIVDFPLKNAINNGLVKIVAIDKREQSRTIDNDLLSFKADGESGNKQLSDGQKLMLKAGLEKLNILSNDFSKINNVENKTPKMMVMCEDTEVSPLVEEFLKTDCDLKDENILRIDSDKKGNMSDSEWKKVKIKLSNVDKDDKIKVVLSVLMLREGFDVNNICVVVPLRSSSSQILLEQTIGRGLRLMWRGDEKINEIKKENRHKIYNLKENPNGLYDILFIIEHPRYIEFYNNLIEGVEIVDGSDFIKDGKSLGDLISVNLKDDYTKYDLFWPVIIKEEEEELLQPDINIEDIKPIKDINLDQLKTIVKDYNGEIFSSEAVYTQTKFGRYRVDTTLFKADTYNEYLIKLINNITKNIEVFDDESLKQKKSYPSMQINKSYLIGLIDNYIRHKLFNVEFNPFVDNNWRILMIEKGEITKHLIRELSEIIIKIQNNINIKKCEIEKKYFSSLKTLLVRENYCVNVAKSIYSKLGYPSNKGNFEKDFMEMCDNDTGVEAFLKIKERAFDFLNLKYINKNGFLAKYYPDFMVKTEKYIFVVETKGNDRTDTHDTKSKLKSAVNYISNINHLDPDYRDNRIWKYVLLSDENFYLKKSQNSSVEDMLDDFTIKLEKRKTGDLFEEW